MTPSTFSTATPLGRLVFDGCDTSESTGTCWSNCGRRVSSSAFAAATLGLGAIGIVGAVAHGAATDPRVGFEYLAPAAGREPNEREGVEEVGQVARAGAHR